MAKYIDADLLRKEIEKRLKNVRDYMNGAGMRYKGPKYFKTQGKESAYDALLNTIDSLQQEQNSTQDVELTDFESALFTAFSYAWQSYLSGEEVDVVQWAKENSAELLEAARCQQEQPEVDLEKEINKWLDGPATDLRTMARHFYNLGLQNVK